MRLFGPPAQVCPSPSRRAYLSVYSCIVPGRISEKRHRAPVDGLSYRSAAAARPSGRAPFEPPAPAFPEPPRRPGRPPLEAAARPQRAAVGDRLPRASLPPRPAPPGAPQACPPRRGPARRAARAGGLARAPAPPAPRPPPAAGVAARASSSSSASSSGMGVAERLAEEHRRWAEFRVPYSRGLT